jgi:hypothetical protein
MRTYYRACVDEPSAILDSADQAISIEPSAFITTIHDSGAGSHGIDEGEKEVQAQILGTQI